MAPSNTEERLEEICCELGLDPDRYHSIADLVFDRVDLIRYTAQEFLKLSEELLSEKDTERFQRVIDALQTDK
jgi:hypothetical protein